MSLRRTHTTSRHATPQKHFLRGNDTPFGNNVYESIRTLDRFGARYYNFNQRLHRPYRHWLTGIFA